MRTDKSGSIKTVANDAIKADDGKRYLKEKIEAREMQVRLSSTPTRFRVLQRH